MLLAPHAQEPQEEEAPPEGALQSAHGALVTPHAHLMHLALASMKLMHTVPRIFLMPVALSTLVMGMTEDLATLDLHPRVEVAILGHPNKVLVHPNEALDLDMVLGIFKMP